MPEIIDHAIPVVDVATQRRCELNTGSPAWKALLEWVEAHGLDPSNIVASTGVTRDADACCIRYVAFWRDGEGRRRIDRESEWVDENGENRAEFLKVDMVEQGETPPLPFPDIIERQLQVVA